VAAGRFSGLIAGTDVYCWKGSDSIHGEHSGRIVPAAREGRFRG
jgi:hypothetical protein